MLGQISTEKKYGGMGYRYLIGFNLAMLEKQRWKLVFDPYVIILRVFKAKYYPQGVFVDTALGHDPSFIWCSIQASQVVVRGGLKWRVGNIKGSIFGGILGFKIIITLLLSIELSLEQRDGVLLILLTLFQALDLLKIHICKDLTDDVVMWKLSRDSCFFCEVILFFFVMESVLNNQYHKKVGNSSGIWKLKVPNQVRVFLWRVVRGCIPMRQNLQPHGVMCLGTCPFHHNT